MSRMSSTGSRFYVQAGPLGAASTAASTVTKTAPVVMTFAAPPAGIAKGDVVVPRATGWKSFDNIPWFVSDLTGDAITLYDSDATREAAAALLGNVQEVTFAEVCVATLTVAEPAGSTVELTTLCDVARVIAAGLNGQATWSVTGYWDSADANQKILRDLKKSGKNVAFKVVLPDGSGVVFAGNVNVNDLRIGVDQAVAVTIGGNISGPINEMPFDPTLVGGSVPLSGGIAPDQRLAA
jgi:hypothetical protein